MSLSGNKAASVCFCPFCLLLACKVDKPQESQETHDWSGVCNKPCAEHRHTYFISPGCRTCDLGIMAASGFRVWCGSVLVGVNWKVWQGVLSFVFKFSVATWIYINCTKTCTLAQWLLYCALSDFWDSSLGTQWKLSSGRIKRGLLELGLAPLCAVWGSADWHDWHQQLYGSILLGYRRHISQENFVWLGRLGRVPRLHLFGESFLLPLQVLSAFPSRMWLGVGSALPRHFLVVLLLRAALGQSFNYVHGTYIHLQHLGARLMQAFL